MYLDEASYADYISAYKKFMIDIATVMVRRYQIINVNLKKWKATFVKFVVVVKNLYLMD